LNRKNFVGLSAPKKTETMTEASSKTLTNGECLIGERSRDNENNESEMQEEHEAQEGRFYSCGF
ncbi:hypothetical protein ILUMI_17189, partial [Ignelater luminosus]